MKRVIAVLFLGACANEQAPPPQPAPDATPPPAAAPAPVAEAAPQGPKPELGAFGFDESGMKPSVQPGDNFYTYANGIWHEKTAIPADRSNYGMFTRLAEISDERTKEVIATAAQSGGAPGSEAQKVGDFYGAYLDEAAIEAKGMAAVKPWIEKIRKAKSKTDLAKLVGEQHKVSIDAPFGPGVIADDKDPTKYSFAIYQGGLGLPDRDYYLKDDPKLVEVRTKYVTHVAKVLSLGGIDKADARAKAVVDLEKKIAEGNWTRVDSRNADKRYNKMTTADLAKKAPGFEWATYFKTIGLKEKDLVVGMPSAMTNLAKLLGKEKAEVWQDYFIYHTLSTRSDTISKALDDEVFAFTGTVLAGIPEQKARWKRAVEQINETLGEAVGKLYVDKYFPAASKEAADKLVKNVIAAMDARLDTLTWMAPETKVKAKEKLAAFKPLIGYPDKWRDYSALEVKRDDAFGNDTRAAAFEYNRQMAKLGKPVDKTEWLMTPMEVNAYAHPTFNEIVFPAAILQPPFFDANADPAINYGGIGAVIGHEISHHFDDQGRKYDPQGRLQEWWTADDAKRFEALTKQLVDQYATYEPLPGKHVNGELTLGENIADLAGLTIAYDAYKRSLEGKPAPVIQGTTGEQRFYLGWAQVWRRKYREEELAKRLMTDPHSPSEQRVFVVRNLDTWYEAFKPQEKSALYLNDKNRVRIW